MTLFSPTPTPNFIYLFSQKKDPEPKSAERDTKSFPHVKLTTSKISEKRIKRKKKASYCVYAC